ncbi:MAG: hypothetical protein WB997_02440 [Candidatus Acidiferrales bacterium]
MHESPSLNKSAPRSKRLLLNRPANASISLSVRLANNGVFRSIFSTPSLTVALPQQESIAGPRFENQLSSNSPSMTFFDMRQFVKQLPITDDRSALIVIKELQKRGELQGKSYGIRPNARRIFLKHENLAPRARSELAIRRGELTAAQKDNSNPLSSFAGLKFSFPAHRG